MFNFGFHWFSLIFPQKRCHEHIEISNICILVSLFLTDKLTNWPIEIYRDAMILKPLSRQNLVASQRTLAFTCNGSMSGGCYLIDLLLCYAIAIVWISLMDDYSHHNEPKKAN